MSPAEIYEQRFVPALFGPWGERVAQLAGVEAGDACLDVGCGTGALTRALAARAGDPARVVGLDPQAAMLEVAARAVPGVAWVEGEAGALPFDDQRFDRVASQFAFMFVPEPANALREMVRVTRSGGSVTVATCAAVERSAAYAVLTEVLHRLFGVEVADAFRAPFVLGTEAHLAQIADAAGLAADGHEVEVRQVDGTATFPSIRALVETERACAWTLGGLLDDAQFEALHAACEVALAPFTNDRGVRFSMPSIVLRITRR